MTQFKVGDWVIFNDNIYQLTDIDSGMGFSKEEKLPLNNVKPWKPQEGEWLIQMLMYYLRQSEKENEKH